MIGYLWEYMPYPLKVKGSDNVRVKRTAEQKRQWKWQSSNLLVRTTGTDWRKRPPPFGNSWSGEGQPASSYGSSFLLRGFREPVDSQCIRGLILVLYVESLLIMYDIVYKTASKPHFKLALSKQIIIKTNPITGISD